ncbi:MAG: hypothetical protein IJM91_05520 [Lachnospiraceae bacterium]|nr:hypothetical protein [Lachnospiraceae bacterium]
MINAITDCNSGRLYVSSVDETKIPSWKARAVVDEASKDKKTSHIASLLMMIANIF